MKSIVLLRHGESIWNKENRFTGWTDVDLTEKGVAEAYRAGNLLKEKGYVFNKAYTSYLKRAVKTLNCVLDRMDQDWIPVEKSWRLNEKHYGSLQGLNKSETAQKYGDEQVLIWRRSYDIAPLPLSEDDPRNPRFDIRYKDVPDKELPRTESLKDTVERILPYWKEVIFPTLRTADQILVAAHGNSLRGIIKYLKNISDEDIADDNAYVYIDKELARASKRAIEMLGQKDIYHMFTPLFPNTSTRIILKKPKTDSSIRKVWLPKTLAYILREWKSAQDELRALLRDEYQDYDLVVALANGRPCEDRIILKSFEKLREKAGLPRVVFHSLRHSSTTYKLKLNHGDLKATQGDTGHAEIDMITSVYAHILDEDRKINAQKFETAFYAKPDLRNVRPPEEPAKSEPATLDLESLVEQLQKSPELASALAALIAAQAPAK